MIRLKQSKPIILLILDGWGHRASTDYNAIALAKKPHWDHLIQTFPHTLLNNIRSVRWTASRSNGKF